VYTCLREDAPGVWFALFLACGSSASLDARARLDEAAPTTAAPAVSVLPTVTLTAPWREAWRDAGALAVQLGDSPSGVRVQWVGRSGVTPVVDGKTMEIDDTPWVSPAWTAPISAVTVESEGPDLVVRFTGPPLDQLTTHPDAPADPAIAWVRLRPAADSWRISTTGLVGLLFPVSAARPTDRGEVLLTNEWGSFRLELDDPVHTEQDDHRWRLDTRPLLDRARPYPVVGLRFIPRPRGGTADRESVTPPP
jgi:hypothetical protein